MKKTILFLLISALLISTVSAQKLLDIYKNGPVKLVADKTFGSNNKWETLFNLYFDTITTGVGREEEKKIVIAPDGSIFMSHKNRHEIWKFSPEGNFQKSFGTKGGKANQFPMMPTVEPIVDGKYVFTTDVNGRLKFFDLDGNYFKSITLKYMTGDFQPIGNGHILLAGEVLWHSDEPGTQYYNIKWRHTIVNLDINTGTEKIIYDFFDDSFSRYLKTNTKDSAQNISVAYTPPVKITLTPSTAAGLRPLIIFLNDGRFIKADRKIGEMRLFDTRGKEIGNFKPDIQPIPITQEDAIQTYEKTRQSILKSVERVNANKDLTEERKLQFLDQYKKMLDKAEKYKDLKNYDKYLPYFSNVISDDEGNLLVFEFTSREEKQSNIFNVIAYDSNGQKLARTSFVCDDYDLRFAGSTFVISKGYAYAVAKLKNAKGMPLRLVKFRITN